MDAGTSERRGPNSTSKVQSDGVVEDDLYMRLKDLKRHLDHFGSLDAGRLEPLMFPRVLGRGLQGWC